MFPSAKPPQNMRLRASSGRIGLASKSLHYIASHPTSYFYPAHSLFFHSAPGRIRTCDRRIRSPLLCPLSYGRIRLIYAGFSPSGSSQKPRRQQYVSSSPSESLVHRVGQPAVHALDDVGVCIQGDGDAGVSEEFLDELGMLACHEEYCSAGVAQIVEPDGWESRLLQQRLEVPPRQVRAAHGCAYGRGEH